MQPIPGCRIRVWKKEWQRTVGSQTSLTTGTRRIANRMSRGGGRGKRGRREQRGEKRKGGTKYRKMEKEGNKGDERERDEEMGKGEVGAQEANG